jgi:Cof subfamily protein (haloacid dehalogenase superfamily)
MDIGYCVCDLDGTLLDSRGRLSEANVQALKKLMARGAQVFLATGRSDLFVKEFVHRLDLTTPVISCNGGLIRNIDNGEVLFRKVIGAAQAALLTDFCLKNQYDTLAYTTEHVYFLSGSQKIGAYHRYNSEVAAAFQVPLREVHHQNDLPLPDVIKFLISGINPQIAARIQGELPGEHSLSMVQSMPNVLDIMAAGITKGNALWFLADNQLIELSRTVVFGDNHNDISMLELAGLAITVANAEPEVKSVARFIAPSNDESGVAYAIEKYILEG